MPIVGLSEFASSSNGEGKVNGKDLPPFGPGGIYHEKQVGSLCALHCINNLLQGPLFDESDFGAVSQELDRAEAQLMGGQGLDYGNARGDGFFNVQVMQSVLVRAGYEMRPLRAADIAQADMAKEIGFILNKREHWFALRRIGQEWFDLNSCIRTPRHYTPSDLRFHISDAVKEGYSVFVVRGDFPRCALEEDHKKLVEAVQGCGRPGQGHSLFAGSGQRLNNSGSQASAPAGGASADALRAARLARFGAPGGAAAPAPAGAPETSAAPGAAPPAAPAAQAMMAAPATPLPRVAPATPLPRVALATPARVEPTSQNEEDSSLSWGPVADNAHEYELTAEERALVHEIMHPSDWFARQVIRYRYFVPWMPAFFGFIFMRCFKNTPESALKSTITVTFWIMTLVAVVSSVRGLVLLRREYQQGSPRQVRHISSWHRGEHELQDQGRALLNNDPWRGAAGRLAPTGQV
mmetsp:Transcript_66866/g.110759  ORF Transcript_66866/g.110759 Transcript_66866/m.110759 type:complete len:465 (+) Transcript_66866:76-1470(+)